MSKKRAGRNGSKKKAAAKSVAQSAVGTVFNIVLVVVAAMLIYHFAVSAYQYGVRIYGEAPGTEVTVTITDGMDFKGIAEQLCDKGLVREKTLFYIQELLSNYSEDGFTEGEYTLSTAMTPDEMMDIMGADGEEK